MNSGAVSSQDARDLRLENLDFFEKGQQFFVVPAMIAETEEPVKRPSRNIRKES